MFFLIVLMMSIALVGIITVQVYWISNAIEIRKKQFSNDVSYALTKTNEVLYKRDFVDFTVQFMDFFQTKKFVKETDFSKFVYEQINTTTNETFRFSSTGINEKITYKGLNDFFSNDSITMSSVSSSNQVYKVKKATNNTELSKVNAVEKFTFFNNLSEIDKLSLEDTYHNKNKSIDSRLTKEAVAEVLKNELKERGIDLSFNFGVFDNGNLTQIKSKRFNEDSPTLFTTALFTKDRNENAYALTVVFPKKRSYVFSDIGIMLVLSIFFTLIIMLAFASSIYQLVKQKQISEIKTDFINNMTHEFKTPIATINLALDAIKNPMIMGNEASVMKYVTMIKEENKRMHTQVENVLRISKLEKNQLDLSKSTVDFVELLDEAIERVSLLLQANDGLLSISGKKYGIEGLANEFHLVNVFVNILENAIKYSNKSPKINIFIENTSKFVIFKFTDEGIGLSKAAQKQVFEKFYREQKGNVHDVKGHGLGLAYVKEIIENHGGTVLVESEKGKGSTFIINLPLLP